MKEWLKSFGIALLAFAITVSYGMGLMYIMTWGLPKLFRSSVWHAYMTFIDWLPKPTSEQFGIGLIVSILLMITYIVHTVKDNSYSGGKPK